jgi:hypothetical protein
MKRISVIDQGASNDHITVTAMFTDIFSHLAYMAKEMLKPFYQTCVQKLGASLSVVILSVTIISDKSLISNSIPLNGFGIG